MPLPLNLNQKEEAMEDFIWRAIQDHGLMGAIIGGILFLVYKGIIYIEIIIGPKPKR